MITHFLIPSLRNVYANTWAPAHGGVVLFVGGQTGHSCNNRVLGQCSDEVWQLNVTRLSFTPGSDVEHLNLVFSWSVSPVGRLSFGGRCGMAVIRDTRSLTGKQTAVLGLVGGQLSYPSNDSGCTAPIETVNSAYYSSYYTGLFNWTRGRDAPFSPRRSMQEDDAFLTSDDRIQYTAATKWGASNRNFQLDKSVSLTGGIRFFEHRLHPQNGTARLTRAEVYADVYSCTLITPEYDSSPLDCDWSHSSPLANLSRPPPYTPTGSLPLPTAFSAQAPHPFAPNNWLIRFGGASCEEAMRLWLSTPPIGVQDSLVPVDWTAAPANVTLMLQPLFVPGMPEPLQRDMRPLRFHMPLIFTLTEEELNDDHSVYNRGTPAVMTHLLPTDVSKLQPHITTLHLQPQQMVQTPDDSTWAVPQAASALNSTRPSFAFSMQRKGHSQERSFAVTYITGGHSGGLYYNDWVSFTAQGCLWPMDPSYRSLLGPLGKVVLRNGNTYVLQRLSSTEYDFANSTDVPQVMLNTVMDIQCAAGHHFSPPLEYNFASVRCTGAGLWMDTLLGSIRRCVPDQLHCAYPFTDAGYGHCVDPEPDVTGITMHVVAAFDQVNEQPSNYNEGVIYNLRVQWFPLTLHQQLYVTGRWLTYPLQITVLGYDCLQPTLLNTSRYCTADGGLCRDFGTVASCTIRGFLDTLSTDGTYPVTVTVGHRSRYFPTIDSYVEGKSELTPWPQPMDIYLAFPRISQLTSDDCSAASTALQLVDCPADRPFLIEVCGENIPYYANSGQLPVWTLSTAEPLYCSRLWRQSRPETERPCDPRIPELPCWQSFVCAICEVQPLIGPGHMLRVRLTNGLTNEEQNVIVDEAATISFAACQAGFRADIAVEQGVPRQRCEKCAPGYSTLGLPDQRTCTPCAPGQFTDEWGSPECRPCPVGSHSPQLNASACTPCGANSWARFEGLSECNECGEQLYKRLPPSLPYNASVVALPSCDACPVGATCDRNGTITAAAGYFLVVDSGSGEVSSVDCFSSACIEATSADECRLAAATFLSFNGSSNSSSGAQRVGSTGPAVINCCGANRRPAVDSDGVINVLCATCKDGYREIQGECIVCDSVQWGQLIGLLLAAFLFVYVLHRMSHGAGGSATQPILAYFVQMSLLFLASDSLPLLLSLVNIDLVGDGTGTGRNTALRTCVVPLTDEQKMVGRLLSPAVFMLLLAALLGLQLLVRWAINKRMQTRSHDAHGADGSRDSRIVKAYRWLLPAVPATTEQTQDVHKVEQSALTPSLQQYVPPAHRRSFSLLQSSGELHQPLMPSMAAASDGAEEAVDAAAVVRSATGDSFRGVLLSHLRTLIKLCLFSYNAVTLVSLACFHTRDVREFGHRLWQYPTIDTSTASYAALAVLFIVMLVCVVLGGPLALLAYLVHCQRRGIIGPQRDSSIRTAADLSSSASTSQTVALLLTASYAPSYWWYPVFVLLRRLSLILLLTFVSRGVYSWLTVLNNAFLTIHLLVWPYRHSRDSVLELLTLGALTTQTGILSAYSTQLARPAWVRSLLWLLFAGPCLTGGGMALWSWREQLRSARELLERGGGAGGREAAGTMQAMELG